LLAGFRRSLDTPLARTAAVMLLIPVAYYVGSRIGFLLKVPSLTTSLLWPPNAILTAALLLSPPRRWALYLLAAFPAHVAAQLDRAFGTPFFLLIFLTNCSEAIIAAGLVRRFAPGGRVSFDSLRGAGTFIICAGLAAPFVSSFLDAAVVTTIRGDDYWLVWRTRFFANTLTALTVVPPLVMAVNRIRARTRIRLRGRAVEAAALGASLVIVSIVGWHSEALTGVSLSPMVPIALLLPLLAWAAMRLGPAATSAAMLAAEIIAVVDGIHAQGPFPSLTPLENVLSLQIVLAVLTIPLMCFAALLEEHERTQHALVARLSFEEKLSQLSRAFVHLPSHEIGAAIEIRLKELGEYLGTEHITILELLPAGKGFVPTHLWTSQPASRVRLPLPTDTSADRLTEVALRISDVCVVSFGPLRSGEPWRPEMVPQLRLVAEVFSNAIARKSAEDALRGSERLSAAILGSLTSSVAVLNRDGRVVAINAAWRRFGQTVDGGGRPGIGVGATAEALCHHALTGSPLIGEALVGIRAVIDGKRPLFALEYPRAVPFDERWFAMAVLPLNWSEGGVVISLTDITERRRMELENEQTRQELAHFTRVSTMGELTASLAHELNQPLTGILANAQAAQRFLAARPPRLNEVRESLADIVADDRRAGEVIRRLRDLLRKGKVQRVALDLNAVVGEVTKLISTDALLRNISIALELDPHLPLVTADRVQMQQVVLNLLLNAMEALSRNGSAGGSVTVCTKRGLNQSVHVTVRDTGPGLPPERIASIFEPFYTTKPDGMGMGLSIARSIVSSSGGRIWAANNPTGGASFQFTLGATGET
jgi:two-component system sensor kinase FixL